MSLSLYFVWSYLTSSLSFLHAFNINNVLFFYVKSTKKNLRSISRCIVLCKCIPQVWTFCFLFQTLSSHAFLIFLNCSTSIITHKYIWIFNLKENCFIHEATIFHRACDIICCRWCKFYATTIITIFIFLFVASFHCVR